MIDIEYPVGGSLARDNPFYVQRQADTVLYDSLRAGKFCYVFNSRQMGKTSLLVQTQHQLEQDGLRCCTIDLTSIGSEMVTPQQWYKGVVFELWRGFGLRHQFNLRVWWQDESDLSVLQRLQRFISGVLVTQFSEPLVIFIDEIDSVLSLPFAVDDFFALIRFCYNQRAIDPIYHRVSFVLAGVATPSDLIQDKSRTPFNIGTAIELTGFDHRAATPLLAGLKAVVDRPDLILSAVLDWTGGQPFLTQKLCQFVVDAARRSATSKLPISPGTEAFWVGTLVHDRMLRHWESQDEPEHLRTIRDRLERGSNHKGRLLGLYQQILQAEQAQESPYLSVAATDSREQAELLLTGLVVKRQGCLRIKNRIYQQVFDLNWVTSQLVNLRPYSQSLDAWVASDQHDSSRLLRGQALKDAQQWAQGKALSDRDYQFLAASQERDRQEAQQTLEVARLKEVEARLVAEQNRRRQERKATRLQRLLLIMVSLALLIAITLGITIRQQYHAAVERERLAKISEIHTLVDSAKGLFASNQKLDALIAALKARAQLRSMSVPPILQNQVELVLQQAISGADEYNRLSQPTTGRYGLAVSPDGQVIVTSGSNNTLHLWARDGQHLRTLEEHSGPVLSLAISPTGDRMASGSSDRTIRLWQLDGTFFRTLKGHQGNVLALAFSPDGQMIVSGSDDTTIKLWRRDGILVRTITEHTGAVLSVCFSSSGEFFSSSDDGSVKRWSKNGELLSSFKPGGHILRIAVNPKESKIATASDDQTVKLWTFEGALLTTLRGHVNAVNAVTFSTDGRLIASASSDRTLKLWTSSGILLKTFAGHNAPVTEVAFMLGKNRTTPDHLSLISLAWDHTVRLWHPHNQLVTALTGHNAEVWNIAFNPEGTQLASVSSDQTIRLWQIRQRDDIQILSRHRILDHLAITRTIAFSPTGQIATAGPDQTIILWSKEGNPQVSFKAHNSHVHALTFSPNGQWLASVSTGSTIKVWNMQPSTNQVPPLLATLTGHQSNVLALAFSPNSRVLASASSDGTVKLWTPDGRSLSTFDQHRFPVWAVAFNPVQTMVASAGEDQTILIWQPDGTVLNRLTGHEDSIRTIAFSPNGLLLASGSQDGVIKLWQRNGTLLTTLQGHHASVTNLQFSPDNQLLASASEDNTMLLWDVKKIRSIDQIVTYSCDWIKDYGQTNLNLQEVLLCPNQNDQD